MNFKEIQKELSAELTKVMQQMPDVIENVKKDASFQDKDMAIAMSAIQGSMTVFLNVLHKYDEMVTERINQVENRIDSL